MDPIGNRPPTSEHGVIRDAQKAMDAAVLRLVDGASQAPSSTSGANGPPPAPVAAEPREGSTIHVVA